MKVFPRRIFENLDSLSRLPLIVEEFDFKFLIEITLTLSFFFRWQRFTEWREIQILRILGRSICITFAAVSFPNDRVSNTLSSLFENTTRDTMYTQQCSDRT